MSDYEKTVREWAGRHDIRASLTDLRAAFDDARTAPIAPPEQPQAAGKWTPEKVKQMLDSWGHFSNLQPEEYQRIADEHNADIPQQLRTLRQTREREIDQHTQERASLRTALAESQKQLLGMTIGRDAYESDLLNIIEALKRATGTLDEKGEITADNAVEAIERMASRLCDVGVRLRRVNQTREREIDQHQQQLAESQARSAEAQAACVAMIEAGQHIDFTAGARPFKCVQCQSQRAESPEAIEHDEHCPFRQPSTAALEKEK